MFVVRVRSWLATMCQNIVVRRGPGQRLPGSVAGAVVDDNDFISEADRLDAFEDRADRCAFVVNGDDDGEAHGRDSTHGPGTGQAASCPSPEACIKSGCLG